MAVFTHSMAVRHAHVAFSRLLLSCERLVAADPVGVTDDDFDVDHSCPGNTSSSTRLRLLKSYVPVLESHLEALDCAIRRAGEVTTDVTPGTMAEYARQVAEIKAVLASALQMAETHGVGRVALSGEGLSSQARRRDRMALLQTSEDPPAALGMNLSPKSGGSIPSPTHGSSRASPTHAHASHGPATEDTDKVRAPDDVVSDAGSRTPEGHGGDTDAELFSADGLRRRNGGTTVGAGAGAGVGAGAGARAGLGKAANRSSQRGGAAEQEAYDKLMEERDLQTRLEEDMLPMTRSFLEAAKAINQRIGDDNKKLEAAAHEMENNVAEITKAKHTLETQNRGTWSSLCRTVAMLLAVSATFLFVYFVIRITPQAP